MAQRNRSGGGGRRRAGGDEGPDLFAQHLSEVVKQAFAATSGEAGAVEGSGLLEAPVEDRVERPVVDAPDGVAALMEVVVPGDLEGGLAGEDSVKARAEPREEPLQARMLNEYVYCPRLFYYEYVEGTARRCSSVMSCHSAL